MVKTGIVLGRFQPFHRGHLKYILLALLECENLIIGITTPGRKPGKNEPSDPRRFGKENNPFTFKERKEMIQASLKAKKINLANIQFIHFIPSKLNLWFKKVPKTVTYFLILRIGDKKQALEMKSKGLNVKVLKLIKEDKYKGLNVRNLLKTDSNWENLVPIPVAKYIKNKKREKNLQIA